MALLLFPQEEDLIDNGSWNHGLVTSLSFGVEQRVILSIPLPLHLAKDKFCWKYEKKDMFTVKSAYGFSVPSPPHRLGKFKCVFTKLWNLPAPPKVVHTIWRSLIDVLPVITQLRSKRGDVSALCPVCCQADETIMHLFLQCPLAHEVWNLSKQLGGNSR